jgi:cytosine deaminase
MLFTSDRMPESMSGSVVVLAHAVMHRIEKCKSAVVSRRYYSQAFMDEFMRAAIEEAEQGLRDGGIPIGSVLVLQGKILGRGHNSLECKMAALVLHGEMDALENTGRLAGSVYRKCTIYTTLSPCAMCSGAILLYAFLALLWVRIKPFSAKRNCCGRGELWSRVLQDRRCIELMTEFIRANPGLWGGGTLVCEWMWVGVL